MQTLGEFFPTFGVSFGVLAVYCGILVVCFWHLIPVAAIFQKSVSEPGGRESFLRPAVTFWAIFEASRP